MWWRPSRLRGYYATVSTEGSATGSAGNILMMVVAAAANQKKRRTTTLGGMAVLTLVFLVYYICLYSNTSNYVLVVPAGEDNPMSLSPASALHLTGDKRLAKNAGSSKNEVGNKMGNASTPAKKIGAATTTAEIYDRGFRIDGRGICTENTRLLIIITSSAASSHAANRRAIRMTWMSRYGGHVSTVFLLGTPNKSDGKKSDKSKEENKNENEFSDYFSPIADDSLYQTSPLNVSISAGSSLDIDLELQQKIILENQRYGDIVQTNVRDTYTNLTLKSIAALEWTLEYCRWARYVLKTDDDMFIDVQRLLIFIRNFEVREWNDRKKKLDEQLTQKTKLYLEKPHASNLSNAAGSLSSQIPPISNDPMIWGRLAKNWKPIRQLSSKYYVSRQQYKPAVYPNFCTGPAYLLTRGAVGPIYKRALGMADNRTASQSNLSSPPYLKLEDVFLTGIVAQDLGIPRKHNEAFANKRLSGRQLEKSICFTPTLSKINSEEASLSYGKVPTLKKKFVSNNIISIHMVKYHEQFDLWRRLMDGRTKCK
ncbi:uncharacterized protein LOC126836838 [Adelges cooleyi]|uniref:uncharacterized protein LOC126836838 n=1 Tax=Adelges cooleyi TaxID=133065 RepID=UPI0021808D7E|nr:uncharacterized protein LOC126836838 [Adelges cooleyi]